MSKTIDKPVNQLGRPSNNVSIGIVGLPNVGKSSLFNCLTKLNVPAENYPFCTIDPSTATVIVPDERFTFLCQTWKPKREVAAVLTVTDIAGLVKGASEGRGLGANFLSHIQSVDAIYHVVRGFKNKDIEHVEGSVDPVRDLQIIRAELMLKDLDKINKRIDTTKRVVERQNDKQSKLEYATLLAVQKLLTEDKMEVRFHSWNAQEVDFLNELALLTAKPAGYLINISEEEFLTQKNKFIPKMKEYLATFDKQAKLIPFSAALEAKLMDMQPDEAKTFLEQYKVPSMVPKIITVGYHTLDLIHFFTAGEDEVRAWTIKKGSLAPQAAGVIHTDFMKNFIAAETYAYDDFKECGSENAVKAAGKYRAKGKDYVVQDGDIMFFKHNAGGAAKKK